MLHKHPCEVRTLTTHTDKKYTVRINISWSSYLICMRRIGKNQKVFS